MKSGLLCASKFLSAAAMVLLFHASISRAADHPWIEPPIKLDAQAYITNLKSGDKVVSPFVVKFGMRYWGVAPIAHKNDLPRTGHFHLLIDTMLPSPINVPIPFNKNYVHFGKGQMEAIVDLPPGQHSLRLLLANHDHVPFFVFSDLVTVTVTERNAASLPADYGKVPRLEILNIKNGENLIAPFLMQFHASGLNIAPAETKLRDTGYFQVKFENVSSPRKADVVIPFHYGTTEASFNPPIGTYRAQLQFVENVSRLVTVASEPISISVMTK